jgi:hypothetical protein
MPLRLDVRLDPVLAQRGAGHGADRDHARGWSEALRSRRRLQEEAHGRGRVVM